MLFRSMEMPFCMGNLQMALWKLVGCVVLSVILIYWCILPIPFVMLIFWYYLRQYLQLQRKLKRLARVLRSPIFQFEGESYAGATTIRAYESQKESTLRCCRLMDNGLKCEFYISSLNCWVTLRVQLVSLFMNIFTIMLVVLLFFIFSLLRMIIGIRLW